MDIRWLWMKVRDFLKRVAISRLLMLAGILLVLLAATLAVVLRPTEDPLKSGAVAAVLDRGVLRVAVRDQMPRFGEYDEKTDTFSGLEADIARAITKRVFNGGERISFVPVNVRTRTAKLEFNEADITLAMFNGSLNTTYLLSKPYYIDAHAIMVRRDSFTSLASLDGHRVGVLQGSQSQGALAKVCQQRKLDYAFVIFASYAELKEALNFGQVDAIALEAGALQSLYDNTKVLLDEAVSRIPYCVVAKKGNEALIEIANQVIDEMQKSGEMHALIAKWGLPDFTS